MINSKLLNVSITVTENLSTQMNKYIINKSESNKNLTLHLTPYQFRFYKSIKKGDRSRVFSYVIQDFLDVLEKNNEIESVFCSKCELVRSAIVFNKMILKKTFDIIPNKDPHERFIEGRIPIGNVHHLNGDWQYYHNEEDMLRFYLLESIHKKVKKFYNIQQIASNFSKFYKVYKDGLLDNTIKTENQIRKIKIAIEK